MDDFSFLLGVHFVNQFVYNSTETKILGYIPKLVYREDNIFAKTCDDVFASYLTPMTIEKSYGVLAKEFIYLLSSLDNIEEIFSTKRKI